MLNTYLLKPIETKGKIEKAFSITKQLQFKNFTIIKSSRRNFSTSSILSLSLPLTSHEYTQKYPYPHTLPTTVVKQYFDSATAKNNIVNDFNNKSVIYMWFNKVKNEVYIGSAFNAKQRLIRYYYKSHLVNQKNSRICRSILKYGHNNYSLFILQVYGEKGNISSKFLLEKEKFYLDWALKTYGLGVLNLRPVRGSKQNFRLSRETILKLIGKKHSNETRLIMSLAKMKENNPNYGKSNVVSTCVNVEVKDKETNTIIIYTSFSRAAKELKTTIKTLKSYIGGSTLFRDKFEIKSSKPQSIALSVKVTNLETNQINIYDSIRKAAVSLTTSPSVIYRHIKNNNIKPLKGKYKIELL